MKCSLFWFGLDFLRRYRCLTVIHCLNSELLNNLHALNFKIISPNVAGIVVFNLVHSVESGKTSPRNVCSLSRHCVLQCLAKCIDLACESACGCACGNGAHWITFQSAGCSWWLFWINKNHDSKLSIIQSWYVKFGTPISVCVFRFWVWNLLDLDFKRFVSSPKFYFVFISNIKMFLFENPLCVYWMKHISLRCVVCRWCFLFSVAFILLLCMKIFSCIIRFGLNSLGGLLWFRLNHELSTFLQCIEHTNTQKCNDGNRDSERETETTDL